MDRGGSGVGRRSLSNGRELDALDLVRRYAVILDWGSGELQFRDMFRRRSAAHWAPVR